MDKIGHVRPFEIPGYSKLNDERFSKNDFVIEGPRRKSRTKAGIALLLPMQDDFPTHFKLYPHIRTAYFA